MPRNVFLNLPPVNTARSSFEVLERKACEIGQSRPSTVIDLAAGNWGSRTGSEMRTFVPYLSSDVQGFVCYGAQWDGMGERALTTYSHQSNRPSPVTKPSELYNMAGTASTPTPPHRPRQSLSTPPSLRVSLSEAYDQSH